ncbi:MAG: Hsp20/alpha crystallin family protein [Myxococcota bacterium]|nr:Hsp20/alpha crystallin family protein [Myxococcota bacterium]
MLVRWGSGVPSVWSEMSRLSREMDRLFGEAKATSRAGVFPPLNLFDDGESLVVRTEVPSIDPKDLEINATANTLSIKGERKRPKANEAASFHRRERGYGTFSRSIDLPQEINPGKVQASYKLGVLEIMLPKAEEARPRKIEIQS